MSFCAAETVSGSSGGRPGVRPRFLAAAMPSRVRSEMSRCSKWAIAPNTWNTSSPAADEVSRRSSRLTKWTASGLEVGDDFEEFAQGASESVEADHAQPVAGSGVVDELGKTGAVRALSGGDVGEDTDGAGLEQTVALSVRVLLAGGYVGIAQRVPAPLGKGLQIERFGDGFRVHTLRAV